MARIWVGDMPMGSMQDVRHTVTGLVLKTRGGDEPAARLTAAAEFDTDESLLFKHLAEAVVAVSVYLDPEGGLVPLIENVVPTAKEPGNSETMQLSSEMPDPAEAPPIEIEIIGDVTNPFLPPTKLKPTKAPSVAPENRITIDVVCNPEGVAPGEKTTITVTVRSEDGRLLPGAKVTVKAGGGKFLPSSDAPFDPKSRLHAPYSAEGISDEKGRFTTWWVCNPCAPGYNLGIEASKEGFGGGRIEHAIRIK